MRVHERFRPRAMESRKFSRRRGYDNEQDFPRRRNQDRFREGMDEDYNEEEDYYRHHQERWNGRAQEDFRGDGRGYEKAARGFYTNDPPSANSAVVETVFRKPKVFADLNEYDDGAPMIDRVPTAIGYHSMDSAEEYNEEKSRASRYSYDVRDEYDENEEQEEEIAPPIHRMPSPEPDDGDKYSNYLQDEAEYQAPTTRSMWSEDSDSCPPVWRSFSEEKEEMGADWALEQAKRRAALNAVNLPPKKKRSEAPIQRAVQGRADDRSHRERQPAEKDDGGSMRSSVRGSMRDKLSGSREDATMADDNESENHPRTSNIQKKPRKSITKKSGKKGWEAWGYLFNGGGSVKSKKSNDSSNESRSKSMKSKNSKARVRNTRGAGPKKSQPQPQKVQPGEAKPAGGDNDTASRRMQKVQKVQKVQSSQSQSVKKTPSDEVKRTDDNTTTSRRRAQKSQAQPLEKNRSSESKSGNDHSTTGRGAQKNQPRSVRKIQSNESRSPDEQLDATGSQQLQEANEEKSRRTTETGEKSDNTTRDSKVDASKSEVASKSEASSSVRKTSDVMASQPDPEGSSRKHTSVQQERPRTAKAPAPAPPVSSISLPVKVPLKQPVNPVDNDDFIMQVRGEEPTPSPSAPAMDQTEPKQPNTFDGFASLLMSGFDGLSNLGLNEPFSFLDWSGEEKEIEKLVDVASSDSKKKKTIVQRTDEEGAILLAHPRNGKESESFTLDGSEQRPVKKAEEAVHSQSGRRSVDRKLREDNVQLYEARRSGRVDRDSRSGDQLGNSQSEREDRDSRGGNNSTHRSRSGRDRSRSPQQLRRMRDEQAPPLPVRNASGSRQSGDMTMEGQTGRPELRVHDDPAPAAIEPRESQSGRDVISISTIEFPTPELAMLEEDDGSISILGLDRNRSHIKPSSALVPHPELDDEPREADARSKSETRSRASGTDSKKSASNSKKSAKKGKNTFLGKFLARKKAT
eukprot:CAMPEP_0117006216 /NCGR_PEP_ID=MMETSP0472-20121206/6527_1 /TAXON_ID=693140 ORGANISM="Tiarina fusus, Strain LIS" /NCGR_SAMPLE_ID=MMETSP0472 /ASSEMBLY_ACC=CAM_ASM_000603 /LENGTH=969 /DNA_ID=CAMNT_0004707625 /DNA_START=71 /DNA_END=2983 /DNA_ORIENTATION=+